MCTPLLPTVQSRLLLRALPWLMSLTIACGSQSPESPQTPGPAPAPPAKAQPAPQQPAQQQPASKTSAWSSKLAAMVPSGWDCKEHDGDGDGFINAAYCPGGDVARLDCDDSDPSVTPATERWVRPGPFLMGSASAEAGSDEAPVHVVELAGFCLDLAEATGSAVSEVVGDFSSSAAPELPAVPLSHAQASAYCSAKGKSLPTEAQWEKAARGGCELGDDAAACDPGDLRAYPWGAAGPTCDRANHAQVSPTGPRPCAGTPVAANATPKGAGPYGHVHLAGNVWEPVSDVWHPTTYGDGRPRTEPAGPKGEGAQVIRGGGFDTFSTNMRVSNRMSTLVAGSNIGVRCARSFAEPTHDAVEPLAMVQMTGEVRGSGEVKLSGKALYVTAFAVGDAQGGQVRPGASPVAEVRLTPSGAASQSFQLEVPATGPVLLFASLDAGSPKPGVPASGSGGVGRLEAPVETTGSSSGLVITLKPLPGVVPMPRIDDPRRQGAAPQRPPGGGQKR